MCLGLFFVFTPSFVMPLARLGVERMQERRLMRACSAMYDDDDGV